MPRPWREWTILSRMVVSIAALAAVALIVANVAAVFVLRSYLVSRLDTQLEFQARGAARGVVFGAPSRPRPGFGQDFRVLLYDEAGEQIPTDPFGAVTPAVADTDLGSWASLNVHRDRGPYTITDRYGTQWRVVVTSVPSLGLVNVAALSMREVTATQTNLITIDGAVTAVVLLLIAIAAASLVRIGLRPLTRMEEMAAEIAGTDDLSNRVDDDPHTEAGRLGTALNAMLGRIESAVDARTASEQRLRQFLADASHELRTPLTSIQGFAELYRRGGTPPGPELDEAMGRIESEVVRMRVLVNDLLLLARLDEERPLARRPVDLLGVAADTVRDAHVRVPTRFVALVLDESGGDGADAGGEEIEPVTVLGDAGRLAQVATNLVNNALQHTGDDCRVVVCVGGPTRNHSGEPAAAGDDPLDGVPVVAVGDVLPAGAPAAVLEVADTGPGMSADHAARVFERLYRTERSRDRRYGGAGLGLAIVAAIVTAHGGRVELATAPGVGSRFRVLLPAVPADLDERGFDSELAPSERQVRVEPGD